MLLAHHRGPRQGQENHLRLPEKDCFMCGQIMEVDSQTDGRLLTLTVPHSPSKTNWPAGGSFFTYINTKSMCRARLTFSCHLQKSLNSAISPGDQKQRWMKHIIVFLLQVIHLWFEDIDLEETQLCMRDFITLQDSLGIIGKSGISSEPMRKGGSMNIQPPDLKLL